MKKYKLGYKFKSEPISFSQQNVTEYANASGDQNPIHTNNEFASKTIFKETIAHGMMIGAFLGEILFLEYKDFLRVLLQNYFFSDLIQLP